MTAQGVPSGAFGVPGLSFPFLQQPSQIFGLLMGKDITLVHYNAGGLRATASVSYTFRFAIGPVPMSVTLAGSATIEGHFAIGYDTYGLRQVLNGAGPGALLDGIYIDDLDDQGNDVPEIRLIGAISARAAVDLVVVSAGVGGGIEMTVSFDLDDRPNPDGKLRISEIASKLSNPWCLFTVSGKLEAYLEAFVKVDFWFYSKEWTFELARVTLLEFSAACELPTPVLAHFEAATLILHIGDQASLRGVATDKKDEKFIVRQLNAAASAVSVAAFGVYQEYATGGGAIVQILANAADGNDSLSFEPGADPSGAAVAFTIPVIIEGGSGNDQIKAGDAADTINGGEGNDKISGGGGDDTLHGNAGNDSLDGGLGDDWLYGDDGDDRLTGGAGADHAYGGAGDDSLVGGPGSNQSLAEPGAAPDLGDYLYGQGGADTLNGGWGDDWLYGDADLGADLDSACVGLVSGANALDNGIDILGGDDGDDYLFGGNEADQIEGGPGSDWLCGNGGDDRLQGDPAGPSGGNDTLNGGDGDDILSGSAGNDDLYGGSQNDDLFGGDGLDRLYGNAGSDLLIGDEGRTGTQTPAERLALSRDDFIVQLTLTYPPSSGNIQCDQVAANRTETGNADCLAGGADADLLFGESGADVLAGDDGDDYLEGNDGPDLMNGNAGDDMLRGGREDDTIYGDAGVDTLYGDSGSDALSGGAGVDTLYGGPGDDAMQGNESRDTLYGDGGQDDMVGGSMQAGVTDSVDILYGNLDQDVMVGDNALITRPGGFDPDDGTILRQVTVYDLASPLTSLRGADQLYGNEGNDDLYGGGSHDWLYGGEGDDYLEGNSGVDHLYGEAGQDDLIGGSSEDASYPDSRDYLWGGDGVSDLEVDFDVLAGDNASIIRPIENGSWIRDNFGPGTDQIVRRSVTLFDVATTLYTPASGVIGHDYLYGEAGRDLLYGQGGYDLLDGGGGDDYLEGNSGYDSLYGGPGNDDLIGGTGLINGDPELGTPGRLDGNDNLFGGDGFDFLAGDNAILRRTLVDGHWVQNTFNAGIQHERVVLVDVDSPDLLRVSGRDQLFGEADDDLLYGQGRNDILYGGYGSDYLEGNAGSDTLYGEVGQDDLIGGTGLINDDPLTGRNGRLDGIDRLYGEYDTSPGAAGGDGADVLLGDNGLIVRALDNGIWAVNSYNGAYTRIVTLLDVATVTQPAPADVAGGDYLWGNSGDDILYGQGSADHLYGGAGDDYLEGNAADDVLYGGAGQDDLIGGTGAAVSNDPATAVDGRLDGGDRLYGESSTADGTADGNGSDVLIGDNGRIVRPLADGSWMVNSFNGSYTRVVYLLDVGAATQPEPAGVAGADYLWGNSNDDILYGQGLDDQLRGGAGEDYLEGNAGNDIVYGNAGQDDLIGGTGATVSNDPVTAVDGRLDGGDYLYGESSTAEGMADGDGSDVLIGDNGTITRPLSGSDWAVNSFNGAYTRVITLLDVATLTYAIPTTVYGADYLWGSDNDDILYGQGGSDELHGGAGDDLIEGNAASDVIYGDSGDDDLIGGSGLTISNDPATLLPGRLDASTATRSAPLGENPAAIVPLGDTIYGGSGSDVVLGDNGRIVRPLDAGGNWITLVYWLQTDLTGETAPRHVVTPSGSRIHRQVVMVETSAGLTAGSDLIYGGPGEDDLIGQFDDTAPGLLAIGDELYGEGGEDVLLGDNGTIQEWVVKTPTQPIRPQQPFIEDDVYIQNSLFRQVVLSPFDLGGDDRLLGGEGGDWMHGGAGSDLMNGNTGNDRLFGDDGNDALWGGPHHDHLWGGYGADYLDVVPRQAELIYQGNQVIPMPADPLEWFVFAADDNYQDIDYLYGGWEQDALQADVGGPGPRAGDRMIDWAGAYNVYYLCAANYGERVITRSPSPGMIAFLQQLAEGDGAYQVAAEGSSGFDELAMVYTKDIRFNTNPIHPDHPGHFTCSAP